MGNIRYDLSSNKNVYDNTKLIYAALSQFDNDWPSMMHSHYFTELFYIVDGKGSFQINGKKVSVESNDLIIINPNVLHAEKSESNYPLEYIVLGIEGIVFDFSEKDSSSYKILECKTKKAPLLEILNELLKESEEKFENYIDMCNAFLKIFLTVLFRFSNLQFSSTSSKSILPECDKIKSYIDTNINKDITLDSLAEIAHLNKYYLSHSFIKAYGISPIKYLVEQRVRCSKELLKSSDYNVSQITECTGFSSQSYFAQCFKKHIGLTPSEYRKKVKSSKNIAFKNIIL